MKNYSLVVVLLFTVLLQACGNSGADPRALNRRQQAQQGTSVETIRVSEKDISQQVRSFGTVQSQDVVQVTPQVSNRITKIYADLGDTVSQGEPLAKIYDATYQDQVRQAQALLQQSNAAFVRDSAQYQREETLYKRNLISKSDLDNAQATFQNSKSQLESNRSNLTQNQENLKNTIIRSPVYGVVLTRNVAQGDLASSGQVAYEIGNLTGYEMHVYLPLEDWKQVHVGQQVTFQLSNGEESTAKGSVTRISPRLDPTTGLGEVVIAFTNKGTSIYQGVLVKSIINVETHKNAIVIPRSALAENVQTLIQPESNTIETRRTYSAFVVKGDSVASKHELKLGIEQGDQVEILKGLHKGDQIVVTGQESLEDSSKVHVAQTNAFQTNSDVTLGNGPDESSSNASDSSSTHSNNQ